ncbi:MAG: tryptophan synthase subunit alpha [Victivallaceae bacterium]|nr:tryptophan synthase subunit alpha [Victivallaceae bacterium]
MKQNIANAFNKGHKSLIIYVTAGHPTISESEKIIGSLIEAGADLIELGVPFSDPTADGPVIQESSQIALKNGANLPEILKMAARLRKKYSTPLVLFSYYNILMTRGFEQTMKECAESGIDGVLIVDLPLEEADEVTPVLKKYDLALIRLVAPTTPPERAAKIVREAEGFVYYITVKGVTGVRTGVAAGLEEHLSVLRECSPVPVAAGFGIATPEDAKANAKHADGIIVGSAIVKLITAGKPEEAVKLTSAMAEALKF